MPYNHSIKPPIVNGTSYTGRADGVFSLNEQVRFKSNGLWASAITPPSAPIIGTATHNFPTNQATITFTAPNSLNGSIITGYTVTSSGGQTVSGVSSPLILTGLPIGGTYTFTVVANSNCGDSAASAASNIMGTSPLGQQAYTTAGSYTWIAPASVTSVSVVAVGAGGQGASAGGGGGGGGLGYKNNITVVPASSYTVVVGVPNGGTSFFSDLSVVAGYGGSSVGGTTGGSGGTYTGTGGGYGGNGASKVAGTASNGPSSGGGGGAGGYSGSGGNGGPQGSSGAGTGGGGGGGGGAGYGPPGYSGGGGGGGGVGILGQGANGGGSANSNGGYGGSGGSDGLYANGYIDVGGGGGAYGGGGGAGNTLTSSTPGNGAAGAVRIIWGTNRSFPSTNTGDM